jgi:hypothetical protein
MNENEFLGGFVWDGSETHSEFENLCIREQPLSGARAGNGEAIVGFV